MGSHVVVGGGGGGGGNQTNIVVNVACERDRAHGWWRVQGCRPLASDHGQRAAAHDCTQVLHVLLVLRKCCTCCWYYCWCCIQGAQCAGSATTPTCVPLPASPSLSRISLHVLGVDSPPSTPSESESWHAVQLTSSSTIFHRRLSGTPCVASAELASGE
jgi:hypothetical protein